MQAELSRAQGVMKRPVQNVSGGTIVRQARQIENEGRVLKLLDGLDVERHGRIIHTPLLLDQSLEGTSSTANLFIVSEEVTGVSVSDLLRRRIQSSTPISQVILLKVLAGAFQLLAKVHEKGVIWNDVKMDHIFWNAESNTLSFIDWGNSLYFSQEDPNPTTSPMLDYHQLLEEGRSMLEQTSPELIHEIGWPLSSAGLTELGISHLQMRVEYMESYLSMRIIEYKLLFDRYLKGLDSYAGLTQSLELMRALQQLGVEVNQEDLLEATKRYFLKLLNEGSSTEAAESFQLLEGGLKSDLPPSWQIAGYLLNHYQKTAAGHLAKLIAAILDSNWTDAAWIYINNFLPESDGQFSDVILHSLRSLQLGLKPYPLISDDLTTLIHQSERWLAAAVQKNLNEAAVAPLRELTNQVITIRQQWDQLAPGERLGDKLLLLRQSVEHFSSFGLRQFGHLQASMLAAMAKIREVYRSWAECDLTSAQKHTRELFLLEPSLRYLIDLDADLGQMIVWLERLEQGPQEHEALNQFASDMLAKLPPVARRLGEIPWLSAYLEALHKMQTAQSIEVLQEEAMKSQWRMPWLAYQSLHLEIPASYLESVRLNDDQRACLIEFHQAMKASLRPTTPLSKIRQLLPAFHKAYADLAASFSTVFSQVPSDLPLPLLSAFPQEDQPAVKQALDTLLVIQNWKQHIRSGDPTAFIIPDAASKHWNILDDIQRQSEHWRKQILPQLMEIKQKRWETFERGAPAGTGDDLLGAARTSLAELQQNWKQIPERGIFRVLIQDMVYQIDTAQSRFFQFWQSLQRSDNAVTRWLSGVFQGTLSEINQHLLQIARRMRTVELASGVIVQPEMARTRLAQNSAGDLMFNLVQLDDLIMPQSRKPSVFRHWQQQYLDLLEAGDRISIIEHIQTISAIHPLLPWFDELVRRDADYFDLPTSHQW